MYLIKKTFVLLLSIAMIFTMLPSISMSFAWAEDNAENQETVVSAGEDAETIETDEISVDDESELMDSQTSESDKSKDRDTISSDNPDLQDESQDFVLSEENDVSKETTNVEATKVPHIAPPDKEDEDQPEQAGEEQGGDEEASEAAEAAEEQKGVDGANDLKDGENSSYTIDVSRVATEHTFSPEDDDVRVYLLNNVTVSPATYNDEDVLIRVVSATPSSNNSEFDTSNDYDPETNSLCIKATDGKGHSRAKVIYTVVYEAYVGDTVLGERTSVEILFFDDSIEPISVDGDVAYINDVRLISTVDGTESFDSQDGPGYDSSENNKIVRSFDTVIETVEIQNKVYDTSDYAKYLDGYVGFEFVLEGTSKQAEFATDFMYWLDAKDADYKIFEVEKDGNTYQVMRGSFLWVSDVQGQPAIGAASMQLSVAYTVLALKNNEQIQPYYTFWMEYNDVPQSDVAIDDFPTDNYIFVKDYSDACNVHGKKEPFTKRGAKIKISAAPWYNAELKEGHIQSTRTAGYWDLKTGKFSATEETATSISGRSFCYGLTIQIRRPDGKGIKGCELPNGSDITISVDFTKLSYTNTENGNTYGPNENILDFTPILWSVEGNRYNGVYDTMTLQEDGRELPKNGAKYALAAAPFNSHLGSNGCYNGGSWTGTQNGTTVDLTISGYEVDIDKIPYTRAGDGADRYYPHKRTNHLDIWAACFSAGEIWFVAPFYDYDISGEGENITVTKGQSAQERYGEGTFTYKLEDGRMQAISMSNQKMPPLENPDNPEPSDHSNQSNTGDDKVTSTINLKNPGNVSFVNYYTKYDRTVELTDGCVSNGRDWVMAGGNLSIVVQPGITNGDAEFIHMAVDALLKFDNDFFDIDGAKFYNDFPTEMQGRILYAAKEDGSGWDHYGLDPEAANYDKEMRETEADKLVYFSSLAALESAGYTCVGVLGEFRRGPNMASNNFHRYYLVAKGKAINSTDNFSKVFMTTHEGHTWKRPAVIDDIRSYYDTQEPTDEQIVEYMWNVFPSKKGASEGSRVGYENYPVQSVDKRNSNTNGLQKYIKVSYNADGTANDPTAGNDFADSVLVVGYKTGISIDCAQTAASGNEKTTYDMDTGQRVVDYVVKPKISVAGSTSSESGGDGAQYTTTVTIETTLPAKLHYITDSSYLGGTYEQTGEGRQGNISGGTLLDTIVTENTDGTTTLKYVYEVTVDWSQVTGDTAVLDPIYFSCDIGEPGSLTNDVNNNEQLKVTTNIESTEDNVRAKTIAYGNLAEQTIHISKLAAVSVVDWADQVAVDTKDNVGFTSSIVNDSNNARIDSAVIVHVPMNGYSNTHYTGERIITEFKVPASGYEVWYTTDTASYGRDDYAANEVNETAGWHKLTIGADGTVDLSGVDTANITAFAVVGTIPANGQLEMHTELSIPDDQPGDFFQHWVSLDGMANYARSYVVKRSIRGLAWVDENEDGLRSSSETSDGAVAPITVTLFKLDGGTDDDASDIHNYSEVIYGDGREATVQLGKSLDLNSGEISNMPGYQYDFTNMPEGTYALIFNNSDTTLANRYHVTVKDANDNANDNIDSDAEYISTRSTAVWGEIDGSYIKGIKLPATDAITTSHYITKNHDLGIATVKRDLEFKKVVEKQQGSTTDPDADKEFTFLVKTGESAASLSAYSGPYKLKATDGTETEKTTSDGKISLKDGESALIENLEIETVYKITEETGETVDGFSYSQDEETGTLTTNLTGDNAIVITNEFKTVEIPVTKTWNGYNGSDVYTATVTLSAKVDGASYTLPEGIEISHTFTSPDEGEYTFESLPAKTPDGKDIIYSVNETSISTEGKTVSSKDGEYYIYSTVAEETVDGGTAYRIVGKWTPTKTVEDGTTVFTNTWTPATDEEEGTTGFTIRKVDEDGDLITTGTAVFLVQKKGEGDTLTDVGRYSTVNGVATIADLTEGEYVVTEESAPEGYLGTEEAYELSVTKTLKLKSVTESTLTNLFQRLFSWLGGQGTDYSWNGDTLTLTVSNEQEKTGLKVKKAWLNADGTKTAPENAKVTLTLYADVEPTDITCELDGTEDEVHDAAAGYEGASWAAYFMELPKYKIENGEAKEIKYTVIETGEWPGYTVSYEGNENETYAVDGEGMRNVQLTTRVKFTKRWVNADHTGDAPDGAAVTFTLYADGEATDKTITLDGTPDGNGEEVAWGAMFSNLPKYKNVNGEAVQIKYTAVETGTWPGYTPDVTSAEDGKRIVNKQIEVEKAFSKSWYSADGSTEAPEGAKVTFALRADDQPTDMTITLDGTADENGEDEAWKAVFKHLPKYKVVDGRAVEIEYTVEEIGIYSGYDIVMDADGNGITNKQRETEAAFMKDWKNADGTTEAPEGAIVTYELYADGEATGITVDLDGTEDEEAPEVTGGYERKPWLASFEHLPMFRIGEYNGNPALYNIEYTVKETVTYPGYEPERDTAADGKTIINKQVETKVEATKEWYNADGTTEPENGLRVTYTLYADGEATGYSETLFGIPDEEAPEVTGGYESEAWKASFIHLPKYKVVDGRAVEIEYTVVETKTYPGYESIKTETGYLNKQIETEIEATKEWENADGTTEAPEGATVTYELLQDGKATGIKVVLDGTADEEAPEATGGYESEAWVASFRHLPKYIVRYGNGVAFLSEIEYSTEETVTYPGYETIKTETGYLNKEIETEAEATKVWINADGTKEAPENGYAEFTLYADGEDTGYTVRLTGEAGKAPEATGGYESEEWKASFVHLPKYKLADGEAEEIEYTVRETGVYKGYEAENEEANEDGAIVNRQITVDVEGTKDWDDNEDQDGMRPESITVRLYADGEEIDSVEVTEEDDWDYSFTNLPKYAGEEEIEYTVKEDHVKGYEATYDGYDITNYHEPGTTEVSGEKIWDDGEDKDGIRPDSITVELYADGEKIDEKEVTSDDDWEFAFTNLEKMKDGEEIDYTIDEVEVEDYTTSIDGYTITNSHTPEEEPEEPKTGDTTNVVPYACGLVAGLLALIALLSRKRRGSDK